MFCCELCIDYALNHLVKYLSQPSFVFHQEFSELWKFSLALAWIFVYSCFAVEFTAVRRTLIYFFPQVSSVFSAFTTAHWMHNTQGSFSLCNPYICKSNPCKVSAECSAGSWKNAVLCVLTSHGILNSCAIQQEVTNSIWHNSRLRKNSQADQLYHSNNNIIYNCYQYYY